MQIDRIEKAIHSGEVLTVRYLGGTSPGAERQIRPVSVDSEHVRAHCLASRETKTFLLAKLEEVVAGEPSQQASALAAAPFTHDTVSVFADSVRTELESMGWVTQVEDDIFSLHRRFKNGKPMKGSEVSITYEATSFDIVFDGEKTVKTNHRARERPWIVAATKQTVRTFTNTAKAQAAFLEFAKTLAPEK